MRIVLEGTPVRMYPDLGAVLRYVTKCYVHLAPQPRIGACFA